MLPTQLFTSPNEPTFSTGSYGISQLSEFASSMVYLMWHARKAMATDRSFANSEMAYLMWQSRKPMSRVNNYSPLGDHSLSYTASPAFKKFCYQVKE